jgi:hyperosmotically inducible periplasmic protein
MKVIALRTLALPVALVASVALASAQDAAKGAKQEARETKQEAKTAASNSGNAIKDSWITMKVHSQFVPEDALENSDIDVDTKAGVVTLNGTVASAAGKARAAAIAKATEGVKSVTDNLRIAAAPDSTAAAREAGRDAGDKTREAGRTAADSTRSAARDTTAGAKDVAGTTGRAVTDGWIKSKIASQYVAENSLDNSDIDIDVTKGAVVLNGAVRTAAAKTRAGAVAKATDGVKTVTNNLKVDPNVK